MIKKEIANKCEEELFNTKWAFTMFHFVYPYVLGLHHKSCIFFLNNTVQNRSYFKNRMKFIKTKNQN